MCLELRQPTTQAPLGVPTHRLAEQRLQLQMSRCNTATPFVGSRISQDPINGPPYRLVFGDSFMTRHISS